MTTILVVPCYNEAARLDVGAFREYLRCFADTAFVFVNDGSTDDTLTVLRKIESEFSPRATTLNLPRNVGKAEAVRQGLLLALQQPQVQHVGFWDADLATPLKAIEEFASLLRSRSDLEMVFGARVKLLGRSIHRRIPRHYLGRLFATAASLCLRLPIYDTQCGAKLFRNSSTLKHVLSKPFRSRWIFDVEMIARFVTATGPDLLASQLYEYPLKTWVDVEGSKVRPRDFVRALVELAAVHWTYRSDRRGLSL